MCSFFRLQITEALTFLHCSCRYIHRNVCPNSVYISRAGTWKLAGLEFIGEPTIGNENPNSADFSRP